MESIGQIPLRPFGKTDARISALGLGGHHLGAAQDEQTAVEIVHRALDGGVIAAGNTIAANPRTGSARGCRGREKKRS